MPFYAGLGNSMFEIVSKRWASRSSLQATKEQCKRNFTKTLTIRQISWHNANVEIKVEEGLEMSNDRDYQEIRIELLVSFADHPFTQYEGQRFTDMVESIRANGVLLPIVVRPAADGKYEILSGHNRVAASREAGYDSVPAVVREGLTEEEAMLIVTETNLIQRSFADLKHSERAVALATHYNAMKKKSGYRSDLLGEIKELTSSPLAKRFTMDKVGEQYGLSKDTIARYLRVDSLIDSLKERLDNGDIALRVAVTLSYLRRKEQEIVGSILSTGKKMSIKQANMLREESEKGELSKVTIKRMLEHGFFPAKVNPIKFSGKFLSEYFNEGQSAEEIESVIKEAIKQYMSK
jgi:ParB family chromosome partitioning protein